MESRVRTSKAKQTGNRSLFALMVVLIACAPAVSCAQDLAPRAYIITPLHSNAITLVYSYYTGGVDFNGAAPITDAVGKYSVPAFNYYHSFSFFGRSANISGVLPYGVGTFSGNAIGQHRSIYRSGLLDLGVRLSVNLKGGPAMDMRHFVKWKQKTLIGASLRVIAPTGQYNPDLLINWGSNRWSFKPEVGYSRRFEHKWLLDTYGGVWFFTTNPQYFSQPLPPRPQSLSPIGSFEGHLSYDIKPFLWCSLDGNFWFGGTATLGTATNPATRQTASRIGVTGSFPIHKNQSIKATFSDGAYIRFGGDYRTVSVAWQYSWLGKPK